MKANSKFGNTATGFCIQLLVLDGSKIRTAHLSSLSFLCSFFLLTYLKRALSLKTRQTFLYQWFIFGRIGLRSTPSHIWSLGIADLFSYGSLQVCTVLLPVAAVLVMTVF